MQSLSEHEPVLGQHAGSFVGRVNVEVSDAPGDAGLALMWGGPGIPRANPARNQLIQDVNLILPIVQGCIDQLASAKLHVSPIPATLQGLGSVMKPDERNLPPSRAYGGRLLLEMWLGPSGYEVTLAADPISDGVDVRGFATNYIKLF